MGGLVTAASVPLGCHSSVVSAVAPPVRSSQANKWVRLPTPSYRPSRPRNTVPVSVWPALATIFRGRPTRYGVPSGRYSTLALESSSDAAMSPSSTKCCTFPKLSYSKRCRAAFATVSPSNCSVTVLASPTKPGVHDVTPSRKKGTVLMQSA